MPKAETLTGKNYSKFQNGIEIKAFSEVDNFAPALIDGRVEADLVPISVRHHKGVYLLGSMTFKMTGNVFIDLDLDRVSQVALRENLLHINVTSEGHDDGGVTLAPGDPTDDEALIRLADSRSRDGDLLHPRRLGHHDDRWPRSRTSRSHDLTNLGAGMSHTGTHVGGTTQKLAPGDVFVVPAGTAHRLSQLDGPIRYVVYRFEPK